MRFCPIYKKEMIIFASSLHFGLITISNPKKRKVEQLEVDGNIDNLYVSKSRGYIVIIFAARAFKKYMILSGQSC